MGNSAVPYPYAIGRTHTYLVEEAVCIENATLVCIMASAPRVLDPYEVLYGYDFFDKPAFSRFSQNYAPQTKILEA